MKASSPLIIVGLAAVVLPFSTQAADVTWGTAQTVVNNTDIQSSGLTGLAGVNFGAATIATTTVNNGSVDVDFKGMTGTAQVTLANNVTVEASGYNFFVACSAPAGVTGDYRTVMTRHMGVGGGAGTITLGGLSFGTEYQIQAYITGSDANISTISGSPSLTAGGGNNPNNNNGFGQWIVGTFIADGTTQSLTHTANSTEPVINALTIGTVDGEPDTTPPDWIATWPQAEALTPTSITVRAKTDEAGTAYYVVLADGASAPTSAQVKAGTDSSNAPASASGSLALTANTEATAPVGSLSPSTAYDVYFVAEDAVPNLQASPVLVDVTTLAPDTTAPDWIATWPQAEQLSPTSITVRAQTNETGTSYFVVLADGATAPSAAQVKAGNDSSNSPATASGNLALTANTEATGPVTGLAADTSYDVYFIAEDAVPNLQATPVLVDVTLVTPAAINWGTASTVVDNTDIQSAGVTSLAGANFGLTTGTTTTVNNGSVDVEFKSMNSNQSATLSNGVTVSASGYNFNVACSAPEGVTGDYRTVMTRHMGVAGGAGTINLTGLAIGTEYQIQAYITGSDNNTSTISGSPSLVAGGGNNPNNNSGFGQWIVGTFTANAVSLALTHTANTTEPVINALTIGVVSGGGNTFVDWIDGFGITNGLTGFNDDADFDGLDNGLENFLGTAPNAGNAGLTAGALSGNVFTFTHPQNATPADDVSAAVYTWSTDLVNWNADEASFGGITVDLAPDTDNPVAGTTTVSATVTVGTVPAKLFVRLGVGQE
jgi:hypothetical protein